MTTSSNQPVQVTSSNQNANSTRTSRINDLARCGMAFQHCSRALLECVASECECFKRQAFCVAVNASACAFVEKEARAACERWQCDCEPQFMGVPLPPSFNGRFTDASPQGTAAFIVASILTVVLLIVTIVLIVRPKHMRRTQFASYTVLMILMPIAALFNLLRSSQELACAIIEFIFVVQLIAINIVELSKIKRRMIKWTIKILLYISGFVAYAIYFATAIDDILFFVFIMLTVLMLNITLIIELISDEDGDDPSDFPLVATLNHLGEAMIIVGAIIAFVYQFVGDVNNLIGAYMSAGEFQVFLLSYNFILIVGMPKSDGREAFRGFVGVLMLCNIAIQTYALIAVFLDESVDWIKYVMLTASILGTIWGCAYACVSQAAFED